MTRDRRLPAERQRKFRGLPAISKNIKINFLQTFLTIIQNNKEVHLIL
jgi:hypothetical protein